MEIITLILQILGSLAFIATVTDNLIPDSIDKGFMKKLMDKPIIGSILKKLMSFSVLRDKK